MAKHPLDDDKGADAPFEPFKSKAEKTTAPVPQPMPAPSQMPAPVPEGAVPNIQRYEDSKTPSDIGLSDANSSALLTAGLGSVGRIRRVRDADLRMIEGLNRGDVREKVPFQCYSGETILVPAGEDKPGEWVDGVGYENLSRHIIR